MPSTRNFGMGFTATYISIDLIFRFVFYACLWRRRPTDRFECSRNGIAGFLIVAAAAAQKRREPAERVTMTAVRSREFYSYNANTPVHFSLRKFCCWHRMQPAGVHLWKDVFQN